MIPEPDPIIVYLTKRRRDLGLSREALARKTGISPNTLRLWETGLRSPRLSNLRILEAALGCEIWTRVAFPGGGQRARTRAARRA
ncbi:helix-turn-helix domain-containing protein [Thermoactinospora rubra]|uniref:helix-turn-helix domain-containing protein n=1 Tax=Thermoactinospora rubra TaxID=1088767 RepID=UPI000A0FA564|nr:helix-turn-helix transcriptional regulator [Thermoactinospora rubra]